MPSAIHDTRNPLDPPLIEFRSIGDCTGIWEKDFDVLDTMLNSVPLDSFLQRSTLLGIIDDPGDRVMGENVLLFLLASVLQLEDITSHVPSFLVIIFISMRKFQC